MWLNRSQMIGVLDCRVLVDPADREAIVESITWDSRRVEPGQAFLAIKGERVDGNDFIDQAIGAGASFVIATSEPAGSVLEAARAVDTGVVLVADPIAALKQLAGYARSKSAATVVGVSGSSGKTTTKNLIATVLSAEFATVATTANQNNELGVPATVLAAGKDTEMLVVEMGMRGMGQLEELCSFVRPQIGVITNIGTAHEELLGSQENIARAKAELIAALPDGSGVAVLNGDDPFTPAVREFARTSARNVEAVLYGTSEGCGVRATDVEFDAMGMPTFTMTFPNGRSTRVTLPLAGMHNVMNALAAAAVGYIVDMPVERIANALRSAKGQSMRQETSVADNGVVIVNDAYNANPDSMRAALSMLAMMSAEGRRIAVLGDMGELGEREVEAHELVGRAVAESGADVLVAIGGLASHIAAGAREAGMDPAAIVERLGVEEALPVLAELVAPGDVVLVKASRFMELERVAQAIAGLSLDGGEGRKEVE